MASARRKPLEEWQLEDARRLKALFERFKARTKMSQATFAVTYGIGDQTQGIVWQYLNGRIPLQLEAAVRFAHGLGCSVGDFSPTLEAKRQELAPVGGDVVVPEGLPTHVAQELLTYSAQLSPAQRAELLKNVKEAAEANEVVRSTLKVPELRHPEDAHVAKAIKPASRLVDRDVDDPAAKEFRRKQLPLFGTKKRPH